MRFNCKQVQDIAIWTVMLATAIATSVQHIDLSTPQGRGLAVLPVLAAVGMALKTPPNWTADADPKPQPPQA